MKQLEKTVRRGPHRAFAVVLAVGTVVGCGGKVLWTPDGTSSDGGAGGSAPADCVMDCGGVCTKCVGDQCFTGRCDTKHICQPPSVIVMCK
jgi:hypothetical protein